MNADERGYEYPAEGQEKRRFRVRECWDLSTHREPLNRTRRMQRE
jgi:hypothetical protein